MEYLLQIGINTLITASVYTLLCLSFSLVYSVNKYFDMTLAVYITLGAYSAFFLQKIGTPLPLACIVSIAFCSLFAFLLEKYYYQKLRKRKATSFVFMIASLGVLTVVQALIAIAFTSNVQTIKTSDTVFRLAGTAFTPVYVTTFVLTTILFILLLITLKKTKIGSQLRAISDNEELAITSRVHVERLRTFAITFAAALAALAGILYAADSSLQPYMGMNLLFKGVIGAFIFGLTNTLLAPLGAILLAILENAAVWYFSGEWKDAIAFGVLTLILLCFPRGILSK
jgi:branched-chain amino acid transport system permease protein